VCADEIETVGHTEVLEGSSLPSVVRVAGDAIRREAVSVIAVVFNLVTRDTIVLIRRGKARIVTGDDVTALAVSDRMRSQ
jgi:hypothetical protein